MREIDPVDQTIGYAIRDLRQLASMSLAELGAAVGVTYQQIQKYERGTNRVSASMLLRISTVLRAPSPFSSKGYRAAKTMRRLHTDAMPLLGNPLLAFQMLL